MTSRSRPTTGQSMRSARPQSPNVLNRIHYENVSQNTIAVNSLIKYSERYYLSEMKEKSFSERKEKANLVKASKNKPSRTVVVNTLPLIKLEDAHAINPKEFKFENSSPRESYRSPRMSSPTGYGEGYNILHNSNNNYPLQSGRYKYSDNNSYKENLVRKILPTLPVQRPKSASIIKKKYQYGFDDSSSLNTKLIHEYNKMNTNNPFLKYDLHKNMFEPSLELFDDSMKLGDQVYDLNQYLPSQTKSSFITDSAFPILPSEITPNNGLFQGSSSIDRTVHIPTTSLLVKPEDDELTMFNDSIASSVHLNSPNRQKTQYSPSHEKK